MARTKEQTKPKSRFEGKRMTKRAKLLGTGGVEKKRRHRNGFWGPRICRRLQRTTKLLLPRAVIRRMVVQAAADASYSNRGIRITKGALDTIQHVTESKMIRVVQLAMKFKHHRKKKILDDDDVKLSREIEIDFAPLS